MVGLERSVLPLVGEEDFGLTSTAAILAFVLAFGATKALTNLAAGDLAERFGRKRLLVAGWVIALPVPLLIGLAPSWWFVVAANLLLGVNQGLAWSMTVVMKIDLAGPAGAVSRSASTRPPATSGSPYRLRNGRPCRELRPSHGHLGRRGIDRGDRPPDQRLRSTRHLRARRARTAGTRRPRTPTHAPQRVRARDSARPGPACVQPGRACEQPQRRPRLGTRAVLSRGPRRQPAPDRDRRRRLSVVWGQAAATGGSPTTPGASR